MSNKGKENMSVTKLNLIVFLSLLVAVIMTTQAGGAEDLWVVYEGQAGAGHGKHIVIVTGDDEYRSEESMPQLGKILAAHHGFQCTVLFAIDPTNGTIKPNQQDNIPGLEALQTADLMILFTRFRDLPDDQMKYLVEYIHSGKPILGLRTSTHAFHFNKHSTYAEYSYNSKQWDGGFGRQVLGETWINHYGKHQQESTRGLVVHGFGNEAIAKGCDDIWGPSDVYGIISLTGDSRPIVMGQVLTGMNPTDPPRTDLPIVPVAWTKTFTGQSGKPAKVFTTTMGHAGDLLSEGFRRLLVNAAYWCLDMESQIPDRANVDLIGEYDPTPIGFDKHKTGVKPSDHAWRP